MLISDNSRVRKNYVLNNNIEPRDVSDVKINMALSSYVGAVPQLDEKLHVHDLLLQSQLLYKIFRQGFD